MNDKAPVIVSVYNRFEHFKKCISALSDNTLAKESDLFIISDSWKNEKDRNAVEIIRDYCKTIEGFRSVTLIAREANLGAYNSICSGIEQVLQKYNSFIFLEDDIYVSGFFLSFMNEGLKTFTNDKSVLAICGNTWPIRFPLAYKADIYIGLRFSPWGFAMWRDRWNTINKGKFDRYSQIATNKKLYKKALFKGNDFISLLKDDSTGKITALDMRIAYHELVNNLRCIFPRVSLTDNFGCDGSGENCGTTNRYRVQVRNSIAGDIYINPKIQANVFVLQRLRKFINFHDGVNLTKLLKRIYRFIKNAVKS